MEKKVTVRTRVPVEWRPGEDFGRVVFLCSPRDILRDEPILQEHLGVGPVSMGRVQATWIMLACEHVESWTGVYDDAGEPAACDAETRTRFFRQNVAAAQVVAEALGSQNRPNGSGGGFAFVSATPTSIAEGTSPAAPTANPT